MSELGTYIPTNLFSDRNVDFPTHPRLVPDLHTFVMPDGLGVQMRGLPHPVLIMGATARDVLPWLLPMLDGQRTRKDIQSERPEYIKDWQIDELLLTLFTKGLLQEGKISESLRISVSRADDVERKQLLFWGRNLGVTFANQSPEAVSAKLSTARIAFLGNGLFGAVTYDLLARSGCGSITALDCGADRSFSTAVNTDRKLVATVADDSEDAILRQLKKAVLGADLVVTATRKASSAFFEKLNLHCLREGKMWLRANDALGAIEVGPFVDPRNTGCYMCFRIRQASSVLFAMEDELFERELAKLPASERAFVEGESLALASMVAGMVALEVTRILTLIAPSTTANAVVTTSLSEPLRVDKFLPVPRCPHCYSGETYASND